MGEENNTFTETQKNLIYKDLVQLKAKISQILLYDSIAAARFLQEYNEIVENEDSIGNDVIPRIVELEMKLQDYMSKEGNKKVFSEKSNSFLQAIESLNINSAQLNLEDFEAKFSDIKQSYDDIAQSYSFTDREKIEKEIYALQANLIMKQVATGMSAEALQQTITEHDKAGLTMFVVGKINALKQTEGLKDVADKVNSIFITDPNAILKPELWSWLNAADRGLKRVEQLQTTQVSTSTAMVVAPRSNTLLDTFSRFFSKEPQFPLQAIDLRKINIEWLSKYIPKSMLLEHEDNKLKEENKKASNRYVPDSKAVIYETLSDIYDMMDNNGAALKKEYNFSKENGSQISVRIRSSVSSISPHSFADDLEKIHALIKGISPFRFEMFYAAVTMTSGDVVKSGERWHEKAHHLNETLTYAQLLDKTFNTDFQEQLFQEIQDVYIDKKRNPMPVYNNLMSSLKTMISEYDHTKLDFEATENAKRTHFYAVNASKEPLLLSDKQEHEPSINPHVKVKKNKNKNRNKNKNGESEHDEK